MGVCVDTLDHVPPELEDYESALLWRSLRSLCSRMLLIDEVNGVRACVLRSSEFDPERASSAINPANVGTVTRP